MITRRVHAILACAAALAIASGCATPYVSTTLETSDRTEAMDTSTRVEAGTTERGLDVFLYHESDPQNGLGQRPYEAENGVGVRYRHEFR